MSFIQKFLKNESGATAIEYGLFAALIAVAIVGVVGDVGKTLTGKFSDLNEKLNTEASGNR